MNKLAEASAAAAGEDAHDALVWGLIVNIATDDALLKSSDHDKLQVRKLLCFFLILGANLPRCHCYAS